MRYGTVCIPLFMHSKMERHWTMEIRGRRYLISNARMKAACASMEKF